MQIKRIPERNGVSVRYEMSRSKGKLLVLLFGLWVTIVAIIYFLSEGVSDFSKWGIYNYLKACVVAGIIPLAFLGSSFQLDHDGTIRRGLMILDFNIWLVRLDITEVSSIEMDDSDSSNIFIRLCGNSNESLLAIEGFRSRNEADQFYQIISDFKKKHYGEEESGAVNYDVDAQSPLYLLIIVGLLLLASFLLYLSFDHRLEGLGLVLHLILNVGLLVSLGLFTIFPKFGISKFRSEDGQIVGWFRKAVIWKQNYIIEKSTEEDHYKLLQKKIDKRAIIFILFIGLYLATLYLKINEHRERTSKIASKRADLEEYRNSEAVQKGFEVLKQRRLNKENSGQ